MPQNCTVFHFRRKETQSAILWSENFDSIKLPIWLYSMFLLVQKIHERRRHPSLRYNLGRRNNFFLTDPLGSAHGDVWAKTSEPLQCHSAQLCRARQAYAHACRTLFVGPSLRCDWSIRNGAELNGSVYWNLLFVSILCSLATCIYHKTNLLKFHFKSC